MKFFKSNNKLNNEYKDLKFCVVQDDEQDVIFYKNNDVHNINGPAVYIYANKKVYQKIYFVNNKIHRADGPAIELQNGGKEWFLNDKYYGANDDFNNVSWQKFVKLVMFI